VGIGALAGAWFADHHLLGVTVAITVAVVLGFIVDRVIAAVRGSTPTRPRPEPLYPRMPEPAGVVEPAVEPLASRSLGL
jgi:hypothetical protein